jgi:hypothetical protein
MGAKQITPTFGSHSIFGGVPGEWVGVNTPDGDRDPWKVAPLGSEYWKQVTDNQQEKYLKVKNDGRNDDWVLTEGLIAQYIDYSEFTDGGGATGTLVLNATIPAGAYFERSRLFNNAAAEGESTLTIQIGDGTDVDRYTTGTPSVAAAAAALDLGAPSGTAAHAAAISTVTVTLTEDDDFTDITAWSATVVMRYTGVAL